MSIYPDWIGPEVAGTVNRSYLATHTIELDMSAPSFEFSVDDGPHLFDVVDREFQFDVTAEDRSFEAIDSANTFTVSVELPLEA